MQRCGRAKSEVKAPADAEVPTIEATDDPKKGGQEASNDAQPEGAPPQDEEVLLDAEGGEEQAAADDEAGQQDTTKTAIGGVSDVDITKAHILRVHEAIRKATPYMGN